jgi:serine/threonine protein kinase
MADKEDLIQLCLGESSDGHCVDGGIVAIHRSFSDAGMQLVAQDAERNGLELPLSPLSYESPEFLVRGHFGPRGDIFSLGLVMLELLCRRLPYVGLSIYNTRQNIRDGTRSSAREFYPRSDNKQRRALVQQLTRITEKATDRNPDQRPQDLIEFEGMLLKYLDCSDYREPASEIREFITNGSFEERRARKPGFLERLFRR